MPTETQSPPDIETLIRDLFAGLIRHTPATEQGRVICALLRQPTPPHRWQAMADSLVLTAKVTQDWGAEASADELRELATRVRRLPDLSEASR